MRDSAKGPGKLPISDVVRLVARLTISPGLEALFAAQDNRQIHNGGERQEEQA